MPTIHHKYIRERFKIASKVCRLGSRMRADILFIAHINGMIGASSRMLKMDRLTVPIKLPA